MLCMYSRTIYQFCIDEILTIALILSLVVIPDENIATTYVVLTGSQ